MAKNTKYIDGLKRKPQTAVRSVGIDGISPKKPVKKRRARTLSEDALRGQIADDFIQPIESMDFSEEEMEIEQKLKKANKKRKEKPETDKPEKKKKEHKPWSRKKKIGVGLLAFLIIVGALGAALFIWGNGLVSRLTGGRSGLWDVLVKNEETVPLKTDANGRTNILVFGTSGYDMSGSDHDGAQLTDSIMVISLDQETHDIAMVSLPRDLKVGYTCTATGKINEVYWCANQYEDDEEGGAKALQEEVEEILGISIQYHVHLNWGALVQLVDALGGITVTLDEDIADWGWTNIQIEANTPTTLNGEQALGLARARHGTANGDFTRGNSQQKILMAIQDKLAEKKMSLLDIINLANILGDNLRTNFSMDEMRTGAKLLSEVSLSDMRQVALVDPDGEYNYFSTTNINGISYVVPAAGVGRYDDIQLFLRKEFSSDPAARENAVIMVLNGSGIAGVAREESDKLEADGYTIGAIDDAPAGEYTKTYYLYDLSEELSATRDALEKRYGVTARSAANLPDNIYTDGYDFIVILGQPQE